MATDPSILTSTSVNNGYTKEAFIVECSMRLFSNANFYYNADPVDKIAKDCIAKALTLYEELENAGVEMD
jgi:hypothetical protein